MAYSPKAVRTAVPILFAFIIAVSCVASATNSKQSHGTPLTDALYQHIKRSEGTSLRAYRDSVGVLTIGVGHTNRTGRHPFQAGDRWSYARAAEVFAEDIQVFWDGVGKIVTVPLSRCQRSVLTSWSFNVGLGAAGRSTLVRLLNDGNYRAVPEQLMRWDRAGSRRLRGLTKRRAREAYFWRTECK